MRVSEAVNLNISDMILHPERSIAFTGKGGKERSLPVVNSELIGALDGWIDFRKRFQGDYLFMSTKLKRVSVRSVQRWIKALGRHAGLGDCLTPHVVRRTFATHLLDNGADLFSVADLLGHTNLETTRKYARVSTAKRKETLSLL